MDQLEIDRARKEKQFYLLPFFILVGIRFLKSILGTNENGHAIIGALTLGVALFTIVVTWRFARSIQVNKPAAAINAVLSPILYIFQLVVFLRLYSKRTGSSLTFLMGDKGSGFWLSNRTLGLFVLTGIFGVMALGMYMYFRDSAARERSFNQSLQPTLPREAR